ncbi:hypothetical protein P7F60_04905 [Rhizobium sp. YJ-22]|uniref:hypothetical protein n=1 Tax=Rhizobium sp. YJ-22 TaxID=3037556 RepID=UPI002412174D|nr:hypothetical protein [Rhizobium sp. YJ-22]MDG3575714.1 hypothetical protein [Rhizobium sp. YJ-22]
MSAIRIDFKTGDAARFNMLRDQWRSAAASCTLPRAAYRVANVLPTFLNREYGYAFPTDDDLASAIGADQRTAKRGLGALDDACLIERTTLVKRDPKGEAIGKTRRIYLTLPDVKGQIGEVKGQILPEVKGQNVKGQGGVKGQKCVCDGTPVCPYIPDIYTPDSISAYETGDPIEGTYTRDSLAQPSTTGEASKAVGTQPPAFDVAEEKKAYPHSVPSPAPAVAASSPAQEPNSYLSAKNGDAAFAPSEKKGGAVPSVETDPSVNSAPSPVPSVDWRKAKHPKVLQGRPLSRKPFPAPKSQAAAEAFLLKHHVPVMHWPRLMQNLMDGQLYEFDIEPWMDVA